jgi:two-component system chemotaxis response regulator CheB
MMNKIKVLIVDDSILFREVLSRCISKDPRIEVVAKAADPYEARDCIIKYRPDVMICDIEMPKMNGIEFVSRLMPQYPLPVIIVSNVSDAVLDALRAGAVDFVAKPDDRSQEGMDALANELLKKIIAAAGANIGRAEELPQKNNNAENIGKNKFNNNLIIAIGSSTGGTEAIYNVLKKLPSDIPGIVIVQHIPPKFSGMFAERMNRETALDVKEAKGGEIIEPGKVFIAPGDKHLRVRKSGGRFKTELIEGEKVNGHCPSVDVLFLSVAKECGRNAVGVILTGMGRDGALGLLEMRKNGAVTIGQDEKSSVVYGMPKVAYDIGAVEKQLSLDSISGAIITSSLL